MRHWVMAAIAATFVLVSAAAASADNTGFVRGTVTLTGKPAAGVAISLRGEGTALRAETDAAGRFALARVPFGRYVLTAHRGTASDFTQPVEVQSDAVVELPIELGIKVIGRAATSAVRGPGAAPVSVNSIGRAQIGALPDNQSLDRVVQTVPGIVRFSYNEPVAHGFHGLTYEIDGVPLPSGTAANFSEPIDPRDVDSLEVFTGAFPAEFGGSRQGAVVNILSRRSNDLASGESGSFTAGAGSYGSAQTSFTEAVRSGTTQLFLNANVERTNRGIDSPTFDPVHDASNTSNQFLRSITLLGRNMLAFDFSNDVAHFQIPINAAPNPNDPVTVPAGTNDVQREVARFANLVYTNNAKSGEAYTQVAPWYREDRVVYDGDLANDLLGTLTNADGSTTPLDGLRQDRRSTFYGLRVNHFHAFGHNAFKAGVDASVENFSGATTIAYLGSTGGSTIAQRFFDVSQQRGTQTGAYVQDKWTPTEYVSLQAGLRYDRSTGYVLGSQLSPRIEANAQVDRRNILHAYYGTLYAAPFLEDTRRAAVVLAGTSGTPVYDLQPERDQYYEFGLAHTFGPQARATLNFWKRDVRNVLDTTQLAQTPIEAVFNNTIGVAKGVEARVDLRSANGDSAFLSTTLSRSRAGGISGSTFLFCPPGSTSACSSTTSDVTLQPEDHDQTFAAVLDYSKRFGKDRAFFASLEPQYGTGYPIQFQNGPGRLPPHLSFDASFGREAARGSKPALGFTANFTNFTNSRYLIKVNNGFNTTQWGEGFRADLRVTAPF